MHICIDDHSRISYAEILPEVRKERVLGFFGRAKADYESIGHNESPISRIGLDMNNLFGFHN